MNDEIKEIKINKANKSITFINNGIAFSQFGIADEILDYITNLQEENKDLKYSNIYLSKTCDRYKITVRNYKSRNKKAIEYIKKNTDYYSKMCLMGLSDKECEMLLNILEGDDKE